MGPVDDINSVHFRCEHGYAPIWRRRIEESVVAELSGQLGRGSVRTDRKDRVSPCRRVGNQAGRRVRLRPSGGPQKGAGRNIEGVREWVPRKGHIHRVQGIWQCFRVRGCPITDLEESRTSANSVRALCGTSVDSRSLPALVTEVYSNPGSRGPSFGIWRAAPMLSRSRWRTHRKSAKPRRTRGVGPETTRRRRAPRQSHRGRTRR
jgi:hypothetical protein